MIAFPKPGLGENIVQALQKGPLKTLDLISAVKKATGQATVQGVYKSLRDLRKQGIVLVQKKEAVLNQAWLRGVERFAMLTKHSYRYPMSDSGHFLQMSDGDRITYRFKDPVQVDTFWNHVLYILFDATPDVDRWYAYSSHCWFLIGRRKEELALRDHMIGRNIRYLFTVGNKTLLDQAVRKDFDGTKSKYHMLPLPLFENRENNLGIVLNIFGDYVIEAQYDKETTARIEEFYKTYKEINSDTIKILEEIVSKTGQIRFTIMKDKRKASKLSKLFEKHFYWNNKPI